MDAIPTQQHSPQTVGNEFVRQYYTLLKKAPNHLHRFYNNHSSYTHGDSQLVVGQREIQNRIQQLNFKECQANITRVDAQSSPGDGVVLQVSGELSNNGQPMRRFCQTVVLVAQGLKKYYVHNDIFSYHDVGHSEEQDQNGEQPEVQMVNQAVQVSCDMVNLNQGEHEGYQNKDQVREPGIQMGDQTVRLPCHMVSLNRDIAMEDDQDQNEEQTEEPAVQMVIQAVKAECYLVSAEEEIYKEDKHIQTEEPDLKMVDKAVQVACKMVSKHTQPEQVVSGYTSNAASQTVEFSLPEKQNHSHPQSIASRVTPRKSCPVEQQKPKGTPAGLEESPQFIQQQGLEQPPHTVIKKEQKESLPQRKLLFSQAMGGQVAAAQNNSNIKRFGKSLISIELDISIYLADKP